MTDKPSTKKDSGFSVAMVIGISIGALIGAMSGSVMSLLLFSQFSQPGDISNRLSSTFKPEINSKIVELIEEESATIAVVDSVAPAVVSIVVKKDRDELEYERRYGFSPYYISSGQDDQLVEVGSGTGFFVSDDGLVLTNRHVVDEENAQFFIVTDEGEELEAELIDVDPFQDIAVLQVDGGDFPVATIGDSDGIRIGQTVIAIGNSLSEYSNTVTKGVVSGMNRRVTAGSAVNSEVIEQAIQTDAAINPGNSGGPLINLLGEVIGINTAVSFEGESIAFAIPINDAKRVVSDVREFGRVVRPWLGVRYVLAAPESEDGSETEYKIGAMIVSGSDETEVAVFEGSPADEAGLREGDVIVAVDGEKLRQDHTLAESISKHRPGDVLSISILRENEVTIFKITLSEYTAQ